jgi:hypothetical protein
VREVRTKWWNWKVEKTRWMIKMKSERKVLITNRSSKLRAGARSIADDDDDGTMNTRAYNCLS